MITADRATARDARDYRAPRSHVTTLLLHSSATPRVVLLLALIGILALGLVQLAPPAVVPTGAPASQFSAPRAMVDLGIIAAQPRPLGSPGSATARQYLMETLTTMGLHPEVQTATGIVRFPGATSFETGSVRNVVARLPGTANTGAIALDAHYDGAATGPGAADNGAAVVSVLETLRAIKAGAPLKNDVIAVFTDGEENGDIGAAAFMQEHPWAKDVRLALNFENMGSGGPTALYTTSKQNGWLVRVALGAAPHPFGSSLLPAIMQLEPGSGMDLEEYMGRGVPGFAFAAANLDTAAYHTARDSSATIDPRSVQHQGEWALSLTRRFGNVDLGAIPRERDATFFNLLPGLMVRYSQAWALPFALITAALFGAVLVLGFRRGRLTARGSLLGAVAFLFGVIGTVVVVTIVWWAVKTLNPAYRVIMGGTYQSLPYLIAFAALTVALMTALYLRLLRRTSYAGLTMGALLLWTVLMLVTAVALPGVAYLFTWPLLGMLAALGALFLADADMARPWRTVLILALGAVPGILLIATVTIIPLVPILYRFELLTGLPLSAASMLFVALLLGLLVPHLALFAGATRDGTASRRQRWLIPASAALIGLVLISAANATSRFDASHPRPDTIAYSLDGNSGQARWMSVDPATDAYTAQFFPAGTARSTRDDFPTMAGWSRSMLVAAAPTVSLPAPTAAIITDSSLGGIRQVHLRLASPRGAMYLQARITTQGEITTATMDGRPLDVGVLPAANRRELAFSYAGIAPEGVEITLTIASPAPITVWLEDDSSGFPALPDTSLTPRPAGTMPSPLIALPDLTAVVRSFTL